MEQKEVPERAGNRIWYINVQATCLISFWSGGGEILNEINYAN